MDLKKDYFFSLNFYVVFCPRVTLCCWRNVKIQDWTAQGQRTFKVWTLNMTWTWQTLGEHSVLWTGIAQWFERRTRDWKVEGSNPCWSGGRIFFSRVDFLCWLLFPYPFHPRVTTVARKRSRHSAKSAGGRLQLNMHTPYVCDFAWSDMEHGCMVYTGLAPRRLQFHVAPAMPAL